jgi:hypothetical protein
MKRPSYFSSTLYNMYGQEAGMAMAIIRTHRIILWLMDKALSKSVTTTWKKVIGIYFRNPYSVQIDPNCTRLNSYSPTYRSVRTCVSRNMVSHRPALSA